MKIYAMASKRITYSQMAKLLKCQLRTVSDKAKGYVVWSCRLSRFDKYSVAVRQVLQS